MEKRMVDTGNNAETAGVKLKLKKRTLTKLNGGSFSRILLGMKQEYGTGQFRMMKRFKTLVPIHQLSNADHGAGCTDTGQLSRRIGCTASVDYC